jgi:prepilin-type N-terminal cleavage/methylation domain-containing protein
MTASPIRVNCAVGVKKRSDCADGVRVGTRFATRAAWLRRRLRREHGVTLPELLTVLVILGIILAPLVGSFTTALKHEADQAEREKAYSAARLAVQRMRSDVHCAAKVVAVQENTFGGFTLTLQEGSETDPGWCQTVIPAGTGANGVQWCTIPVGGSTTRFRLYRYLGLDAADCDGGPGSTFQIDYIAPPKAGWPTNSTVSPAPSDWIGNLWPDPNVCPTNRLPTVSVSLNTSVDPDATPYRHYHLRDALALRNAKRC